MAGKAIAGSVGAGGANRPQDVMTVQFLLNCIPAAHGGPQHELAIDGLAGRHTVEAIHRLQFALHGRSTGRVDPEGASGDPVSQTLDAMKRYDPVPGIEAVRAELVPWVAKSGRAVGKAAGDKEAGGKDPYGKGPFGKDPFGKDLGGFKGGAKGDGKAAAKGMFPSTGGGGGKGGGKAPAPTDLRAFGDAVPGAKGLAAGAAKGLGAKGLGAKGFGIPDVGGAKGAG
jgi:hypothetical protein